MQDKISLLDNVSEGQKIKVFFDIRGREYNGRYYNNLVGWKLEMDEQVEETQKADDNPKTSDSTESPIGFEDIPF